MNKAQTRKTSISQHIHPNFFDFFPDWRRKIQRITRVEEELTELYPLHRSTLRIGKALRPKTKKIKQEDGYTTRAALVEKYEDPARGAMFFRKYGKLLKIILQLYISGREEGINLAYNLVVDDNIQVHVDTNHREEWIKISERKEDIKKNCIRLSLKQLNLYYKYSRMRTEMDTNRGLRTLASVKKSCEDAEDLWAMTIDELEEKLDHIDETIKGAKWHYTGDVGELIRIEKLSTCLGRGGFRNRIEIEEKRYLVMLRSIYRQLEAIAEYRKESPTQEEEHDWYRINTRLSQHSVNKIRNIMPMLRTLEKELGNYLQKGSRKV